MVKTVVFVFAAGKSSRMKSGKSKMLEHISHNGIVKPMVMHTVDLFSKMDFEIYLIIGFDGTEVQKVSNNSVKGVIRVCSDDGTDLCSTSAETLKKYSKDIMAIASQYDHVILCVGDQPFMQHETLYDFYNEHIKQKNGGTILLADLKGTPLESSTFTRVKQGVNQGGTNTFFFETPDKNGPFEGLSTLADVGVIALSRKALDFGIKNLDTNSVFGTIICHLTKGKFKIGKIEAKNDPYQFQNVNEKRINR